MKVIAIMISYLIGSISTAYLIVKHTKGVDIRTVGSKNAGATNVKRIAGTGPAAAVLVLDILKGVIAVFLGRWIGGPILSLWCGVAVIIGHNWPLFFGLKGGKGTATSLGVIWSVVTWESFIITIIGIATIAITKHVSLGSIVVAPLFPILVTFHRKSFFYSIFAIILMFMTLYRHKENIKRVLQGKEPKLGEEKKRVR